MKKVMVTMLALGMLALPTAVFAGGSKEGQAADKVYELTCASAYTDQSPPVLAGKKFAEEVKAATNGKVIINIFTDSSLGTETEQLTAVAANELDFTISGLLTVDMYCPEYGFMTAPYLYKDQAHLKTVMEGRIGNEMKAKFMEHNTNLLAVVYRGERNTSSNKPIHTPADVKGLKIRMTNNPSWVAIWGPQGLGGVTIPIVIPELYSALQTGTVEASEGPYEQLAVNKFYEVQKYLINTKHVNEWGGLYASEKMLKSLPPEYRKIVEDRAAAMAIEGTRLCAEMAEKFHQQLLDGGMQEINIDVPAFSAAVTAVYDKFFTETWKASTFAEIQSFAK
jgi:tripartite ATP-independent transporter DctP family solute receptor